MLAVHFGAGNIGRGFIGALLSEAGYHTTFVDVNQALIDAINKEKQYQVTLTQEEKQCVEVSNISGLNSQTDPEAVIKAIAEADIVTTAIGPSILPFIAELLADALQKRLIANERALNIIACENRLGASAFLREKVFSYIPEDKKAICEERFGFPNAAVDRIVPNQSGEQTLDVAVEPYFEWVVDETGFKGNLPSIDGMTYVKVLQPYIERKIFTVNTGHIVPAYLGYRLGHETIEEAMQNEIVQEMIQGVLDETGEVLIQEYGFKREKHENYKQTIIARFKNPYISDAVTRVGRNPIRKLGSKDRLIYPAIMYIDTTKNVPQHLAKLIALALLYDVKEDEESVKLQQMISEQGYEKVLMEVSGLSKGDILLEAVLKEVNQLLR